MKKAIAFLLTMLILLLVGCGDVKNESDDEFVPYSWLYGLPTPYTSAEELADAASLVYEGTVLDTSFWVSEKGKFWTVYKVLVTDKYKGNVSWIEYIAVTGGIHNYRTDEQIQALKNAGVARRAIPILKHNRVLEIGSTYVFFAEDYVEGCPYKNCRKAVSPLQFAIDDDPNVTGFAGVVTLDEVYEYFNVNPVVRTLLRVGLGIVIVAAVATVAVLLIRKKKKAKKIEQIPEET